MCGKVDLEVEIAQTKDSVSQIACWCIIVAMHQKLGIGGTRLERMAGAMSDQMVKDTLRLTSRKGGSMLADIQAEVRTYAQDFQLPKNRMPKNRREKQLLIAGNQAAQIAWVTIAKAAHDSLGLGPKRLEVVRQEAISNYRQFNEWSLTDKDWAAERLRKCVEAALGETVVIADDDRTEAQKRQEHEDDMLRIVERETFNRLAEKNRPAGYALLNPAVQQAAAEKIAREMGLTK